MTKARGVNQKSKFVLQIRDTNPHDIPDTDNDDASVRFTGDVALRGYDVRGKHKKLVKLTNTHDQAVSVSLRGSTGDDMSMDFDDEDVAAVAIPAGNVTPQTRTLATDEPWSVIRALAQAAVAPTTGSLTASFASDTEG